LEEKRGKREGSKTGMGTAKIPFLDIARSRKMKVEISDECEKLLNWKF